jgi:thiol-disulfide isomerase/thioredoxin
MRKIFLIPGFLFLLSELNAQSIPEWKVTDLEQYIQTSETPVIISFWATYCIPCIKEIPYFQELVKKYEGQGVKLLLVSLDFKESYPDKIRKFSIKMKFTAPIVWLNETNADYFCPKIDSKWSGVMPATLLVNNKTGYRVFFQEEISKAKLEDEIIKMIAGQ